MATRPIHAAGITHASFYYLKQISDGVVTYVDNSDNRGRALLRRGYITHLGVGVRATAAGRALVATHRSDTPVNVKQPARPT